MDISDIKIGMNCHLTAMGSRVYVITEIREHLFPIGVADSGQTQTQLYVRPIAVHPIVLTGHTNN